MSLQLAQIATRVSGFRARSMRSNRAHFGTDVEAITRMATLQKKQKPGMEISADIQRLHDLLKEWSVLLLGTFEQTGSSPSLRARPMTVAQLDPDCTIYFITNIDTDKVDEASATRVGHVFGQSTTRYCSVRGQVELSRDRTLIKSMWKKSFDAWFDGPDDPRVGLLIMQPEEAEIWDASGLKGVRFLMATAKALITGEPPRATEDEMHTRVAFQRSH